MKKNRIRVLHVNDQKKYGGGENQTFLLIKELEKLNYNGFLSIEYEAQVFGWEFSEEEILKNNYQFVKNLLN